MVCIYLCNINFTLIGCLIVSKIVNREVSLTNDGLPKRASKYLYN
jgi:hypothetical protein